MNRFEFYSNLKEYKNHLSHDAINKYYRKVDLGNGKWRYFYSKEEYEAYLDNKKLQGASKDNAQGRGQEYQKWLDQQKNNTSGTKNPTVGAVDGSQVKLEDPDYQKLKQELSSFEEDFINWYRTMDTYNPQQDHMDIFGDGIKRYQDKLKDILYGWSTNRLNWPIELREEPLGFYLQKLMDKSKGRDSAKSRIYDHEKNQAIKNSMNHSAFSMSDEEIIHD